MYRIGKEEIDAVARVINSGDLFKVNKGLMEVMHCEEELKLLMGCKYALIMTSGKAALISALIGMGIGPGDEVIIPAYTYIATAIAVMAAGAIPVIAEIDETLTLDVSDVEKKISKYTKAIVPVHMRGFASNMDEIMALANKYGIRVLEDACQACGGSYKGKRLGTIGNAGALSYNYYKIISTGEGGALLTDSRTIYERGLIFHDSSAVKFFGNQLDGVSVPLFAGNEYRVCEITGALLREQLKRLDGILADLRRNRKTIVDAVKDYLNIIPSNDSEGDCCTSIGIIFNNEADAREFVKAKGVEGFLPIDTGKHVYTNWEPIMEKRGALHPAMDPFKMEANRDLNHHYTVDMCMKSLNLLSCIAIIKVDPDWGEKECNERIIALKSASV